MTKQRILGRTTATVTAAGFLLLSAGPAFAADPIAQAEAQAVTIRVAGQSGPDQVGGPYRVTNDGDRQTATGNNRPQANLLAGQDALSLGTLAQDATTNVGSGGRGSSAACAGIAGDGSSAVAVSNAGDFCVTPGDAAQLNVGQIDLDNLTDVEIVDDQTPTLGQLLTNLPDPLNPTDVLADLNEQLNDALEDFGNAGLVVNVGAIQSQCTAGPGNIADGSARLTDVEALIQLPGQPGQDGLQVSLLEFTPDPRPNTNIATDLDEVVDIVLGAFVDSLEGSDIDGSGLPTELTDNLDAIREAVRDNLTSQLADQLGPLDENLLSGTLNKQTRSPGAIEVTAVDLQVLPALEPQAGFSLIDAQLGRSSCGPGGQEAAPPPPAPTEPPEPAPTPQQPVVPTSVPAGLADDSDGLPPAVALAALTVLATATGIAVHRRQSRA